MNIKTYSKPPPFCIVGKPKRHHWSPRVAIAERHRHQHAGWAMEEGRGPMWGPSANGPGGTSRERRNNGWEPKCWATQKQQLWDKEEHTGGQWCWLKGGETLWLCEFLVGYPENIEFVNMDMMLRKVCHATFISQHEIWWILVNPLSKSMLLLTARLRRSCLLTSIGFATDHCFGSFWDPSNWTLWTQNQPTDHWPPSICPSTRHCIQKAATLWNIVKDEQTHFQFGVTKWIFWPWEGLLGVKCLSHKLKL